MAKMMDKDGNEVSFESPDDADNQKGDSNGNQA